MIEGYTLFDFGLGGNHHDYFVEEDTRDGRHGVAVLSRPPTAGAEPNYRHLLVWQWEPSKALLYAIMLNPSKARALVDDMTMSKLFHFAAAQGYGGVAVANLSDWRSTDPAEARKRGWPRSHIGSEILRKFVEDVPGGETRSILLAWGNNGPPLKGWLVGRRVSPNARFFTLGLTKRGCPEHPCRLPHDRKLQRVQV